jgi:hypothetical protein
MKTEEIIDRLFNHLDTWRHLPAYQLERRADIFFGIYLPEILKKKFNENIDFIVPEFPVRLGNVYKDKLLKNPNLSFKIDYVAVSKKTNKVYLVELKTDDSSRRDKQDWYLESVKKNNLNNLICGVLDICKATTSKKKYENLLSLLSEIGWVDLNQQNISTDCEIEIVYIQPNTDSSGKTIISFNDITEYLADKQDELTQRFLKSLKKWTTNPNL